MSIWPKAFLAWFTSRSQTNSIRFYYFRANFSIFSKDSWRVDLSFIPRAPLVSLRHSFLSITLHWFSSSRTLEKTLWTHGNGRRLRTQIPTRFQLFSSNVCYTLNTPILLHNSNQVFSKDYPFSCSIRLCYFLFALLYLPEPDFNFKDESSSLESYMTCHTSFADRKKKISFIDEGDHRVGEPSYHLGVFQTLTLESTSVGGR